MSKTRLRVAAQRSDRWAELRALRAQAGERGTRSGFLFIILTALCRHGLPSDKSMRRTEKTGRSEWHDTNCYPRGVRTRRALYDKIAEAVTTSIPSRRAVSRCTSRIESSPLRVAVAAAHLRLDFGHTGSAVHVTDVFRPVAGTHPARPGMPAPCGLVQGRYRSPGPRRPSSLGPWRRVSTRGPS
jgi:hypothetical protein